MLDGLTKRLGVGRLTDVRWTDKEAGCRTSDMLDGLTKKLGVGRMTDVRWTDKEAGCRTTDRCWMD